MWPGALLKELESGGGKGIWPFCAGDSGAPLGTAELLCCFEGERRELFILEPLTRCCCLAGVGVEVEEE